MNSNRRLFSLGTVRSQKRRDLPSLIAASTRWLLKEQDVSGTWGGAGPLDRLISTTHATMALLALGIPPDSWAIKQSLQYLAEINDDSELHFFWRCGPLLNIKGFEHAVEKDMVYMWKFRQRIGVHKDYPIPFFLLKLLRFADPPFKLPFDVEDVLEWILSEWSDDECWYGRPSITSMGLALLYDMKFPGKRRVIRRAKEFLETTTAKPLSRTTFSGHLMEDAYVIFNLCERNILLLPEYQTLAARVYECADALGGVASDDATWSSTPPFGGAIGERTYPTAVMIRCLLSYGYRRFDTFENEVNTALLEGAFSEIEGNKRHLSKLHPFWGDIPKPPVSEANAFVLMPFTDELTEIYERFVKLPIEEGLKVRCVRADDFFVAKPIMADVWEGINRASFVVAELTGKNPNVFYELGMAHVLGKPVILLAQSVDDIPFDLRSIRSIIYKASPSGLEKLGQDVVRYARGILAG